jgi:hypothetical protein
MDGGQSFIERALVPVPNARLPWTAIGSSEIASHRIGLDIGLDWTAIIGLYE